MVPQRDISLTGTTSSLPGVPDRSNRLLNMLIECNFLFNLVGDEQQLLNGICQLIVQAGGYSKAWINLTDLFPRIDGGKSGATQSVTRDYYFASTETAPIQSCIDLPLRDELSTFGVLTLYSSNLDSFGEQETVLLAQLTENLASCLLSLRDKPHNPHSQPRLIAHPARLGQPWQAQATLMGRQPLIDLLNG